MLSTTNNGICTDRRATHSEIVALAAIAPFSAASEAVEADEASKALSSREASNR